MKQDRKDDIISSLKSLEKHESNPLENLYKIKKIIGEMKIKLDSLSDPFKKQWLYQLIKHYEESKIPKWEDEVKKKFGYELEEKLKGIGFELTGHYPLIKVAFYTLEVNFNNLSVIIWWGYKQERLGTCKLTSDEVFKNLMEIHNKITQRPFNDREFLSKLYEAYKISLYLQNKKSGDQAPISDVLFAYTFLSQDKKFRENPKKDNFREYPRYFFSYDLYRLKERNINNMELNLIIATRAYTVRPYDFLWIPYNEKGDGNYISHIKFREVTP